MCRDACRSSSQQQLLIEPGVDRSKWQLDAPSKVQTVFVIRLSKTPSFLVQLSQAQGCIARPEPSTPNLNPRLLDQTNGPSTVKQRFQDDIRRADAWIHDLPNFRCTVVAHSSYMPR